MSDNSSIEKVFIEKIIESESLFVSKANIYSRLLTDTALAENMKEMSDRREQVKKGWQTLLTGEKQEEGGEQE